MERKKFLTYNLEGILNSLIRKYKPEEIFIFGSYASGNLKDTSDIDLLIIKRTDKHFIDRLQEVASLCNYDIGVDFLVYTPEEFEKKKKSHFIKEEVLKKGKLIYEKSKK
ncbi:MAG: nucleotidyltransferase domain-containing protein [Planctomycetota bacterium]